MTKSTVLCTRRLEWDAMHRIPNHESKCRAYHGHRYVAEISCAADELDELGRVIDFGVVKELIGGWIDEHWDHTALLMSSIEMDEADYLINKLNTAAGRPVYWMDCHPTAENIVAALAEQSEQLLFGTGISTVKIRLWETPNCSVLWTNPDWNQELEDARTFGGA